MNKVVFHQVRYRNFLSVGNAFVEIDLAKHPMTLIIGTNGNGKSTFMEAICFGLFGKSWRGIKKPALVNSKNGRDLLVEIEFTTSNKRYKIRRGMKPDVLEIYCNDELLNQSASRKDYQSYIEKYILKLNFKSFTQVVMIGTGGFVPFMQLPAAARREVIEDLLDINVFSAMNILLKERIILNKQAIQDNDIATRLLKEKLNAKKDIIKKFLKAEQEKQKLATENKVFLKRYIARLECLKVKVKEAIASLEARMEEIKRAKKALTSLDAKRKELTKRELSFEKEISFFSENCECSKCQQSITEAFKAEKITSIKASLVKIKLAYDGLDKESDQLDPIIRECKPVQDQINALAAMVIEIGVRISAKDAKLGSINEQKFSQNVDGDIEEIKLIETYIKDKKKENEKLERDKDLLSDAAVLLKDSGIKSHILHHYIPIINALVNQNLEQMDFFISFELDKDLNETIKARHYDEFSYANFSQGEKMRIDLALLMAWRQIASLKNSISTNLLIMDEILDSSLDNNGCDLFLGYLKKLTSTNIFIISHKGETIEGFFDQTLEAIKRSDFSSMITRN